VKPERESIGRKPEGRVFLTVFEDGDFWVDGNGACKPGHEGADCECARRLFKKAVNRYLVSPQPQRQDSLTDQMRDIHYYATKAGCYDAADWIKRIFFDKERPNA
jgi:hypothetical protein